MVAANSFQLLHLPRFQVVCMSSPSCSHFFNPDLYLPLPHGSSVLFTSAQLQSCKRTVGYNIPMKTGQQGWGTCSGQILVIDGNVCSIRISDNLLNVVCSRVWDVNTGEMLNTLIHHCEAVLHLRFNNGMMVTCSKDRSIAVWDMASPTDITLRRVLVGHRAAVNVVDFDDKYIVSASGDRTIKVIKHFSISLQLRVGEFM